jgi:hypothetical protein
VQIAVNANNPRYLGAINRRVRRTTVERLGNRQFITFIEIVRYAGNERGFREKEGSN